MFDLIAWIKNESILLVKEIIPFFLFKLEIVFFASWFNSHKSHIYFLQLAQDVTSPNLLIRTSWIFV